jgi:Putative zinc-finger
MQCDRFREAISARIDGEDPGQHAGALDVHLGVCAGCRAWQECAHAVTRRARLGIAFLDHDLTPLVLAAVPAPATGRGRRLAGALLLIMQASTNGRRSAVIAVDASRTGAHATSPGSRGDGGTPAGEGGGVAVA